eukprot:gene2165-2196_t
MRSARAVPPYPWWRLNQLEIRLQCIEQAMRDLKLFERVQARIGSNAQIAPPNELVDRRRRAAGAPRERSEEGARAELYELLHRDYAATSESLKLKEIILHPRGVE